MDLVDRITKAVIGLLAGLALNTGIETTVLAQETPQPAPSAVKKEVSTKELLKEAERLYYSQKCDEALIKIDQALAKENNDESKYMKAEILLSLNKPDEAIKIFDTLTKGSHWEAGAQGIVARKNKDYNVALSWFEKANQISGNTQGFWRWNTHEGLTYAEVGDLRKAENLFLKALSQKPDDACVYTNMGFLCSKEGKYAEAITWYDKALVLQPKNFIALRDKGIACTKTGRKQEAIDALLDARKLVPNDKVTNAWISYCNKN